ncbi:YdcF family protein [Prosthecomicrobium sp. N25]|uniref:YdcF family protein n=1 Tax=Prosthecomicrobium sp. N25 TaxID=3129254 RepID=UPI0030773DE8
MFFVLSKIGFFLVRPVHLLIALLAVGAVLERTRLAKAGRRMVAASAVLFVVLGFTPLADMGLSVIEDRFPAPGRLDPPPDGIVVLGGALDVRLNAARKGFVALNESAERMTEVAALARLYPEAKIVFTGGSDEIFPGELTEAEAARTLFESFGIPASRIVLEDQSRNTWENGVFTRRIVDPKPGQRWLLVTSAWHMPRSVGIFRKAGWTGIVAYPVDYRTRTTGTLPWLPNRALDMFLNLELLAKETIGMAVYWMTGRSDALFPAP